MPQEFEPWLRDPKTPPEIVCDYLADEMGLDTEGVLSLIGQGLPFPVLLEWYDRTGEDIGFDIQVRDEDSENPFSFSKVRPTCASLLRGDDFGTILILCSLNRWPLSVAAVWCESRHETFTDPYTHSEETFELAPGLRWLCDNGKRPEQVDVLDWRWWSPDDGEGHPEESTLALPPGDWHLGYNNFGEAIVAAARDIVMATVECPACQDDGTRWCDFCACHRSFPWLETVGLAGVDWYRKRET